jgi:hypothetical protein
MPLTKIPLHTSLVDKQWIQVSGPDDIISGFAYDAETRSLWGRDSQISQIGIHGTSHISSDPIPTATCDTMGLMAADDKCKLDALTQMRLGIVGFQGGGFPDDGGWLQGDVILAAGSEFVSIERFGNVIRWTVDSPIPLSCNVETCASIFWVQDETEVASIRPPSCAGKLPGTSSYGELKVYLLPESMIIDPADPATSLNKKTNYPSLIFKRYDDSVAPGVAEFEMVLKRTASNNTQTNVGWAFTPGAGATPECVWFMGSNSNGDQVRFDLNMESAPGILGGLLYNGNLLTKRSAVITDYTTQILATNQYVCKWWDVHGATVADNASFIATNVWQYSYPEGGVNSKQLILDKTIGILPIGTIVDMWFFQVGSVNDVPIRQYVFNCKPALDAQNVWSEVGGVEFGTQLTARTEPATPTATFDYELVNDVRNLEHKIWGMTGIDPPYLLTEVTGETGGSQIMIFDVNDQYIAHIDTSLPGLRVDRQSTTETYRQRPVCLWNRHIGSSSLVNIHLGRPDETGIYPPYDILLNAPIDSNEEYFLNVVETGPLANDTGYYALFRGATFEDLPQNGYIRLLTGLNAGTTWRYDYKAICSLHAEDVVALIGSTPFTGLITEVAQVLHQEYNSPCVRLNFTLTAENKVELYFKVGTLDMGRDYEDDTISVADDFVRGLAPGYAVSGTYIQDAPYNGSGTAPGVNVPGFIVYDGGYGLSPNTTGNVEYWNELEIMQRGSQVWIWWNGLLIPPSTDASGILPTPVAVSTPYFPIIRETPMGKFGMRMFPGCKLRRIAVRGYDRAFSEYVHGQLELA